MFLTSPFIDQAFSPVCAVCSPKPRSIGEMAIFRQLSQLGHGRVFGFPVTNKRVPEVYQLSRLVADIENLGFKEYETGRSSVFEGNEIPQKLLTLSCCSTNSIP
jgi:hypothetical protein